MTHDDEQFARALRAQVDEVAPRIDVRTDGVVPAARRRRARRAIVAGVASLAVVGLAGAWAIDAGRWVVEVAPAGPALDTRPSASTTSADTDTEPRATLDPATGTITTPMDAWSWDSREYAISRTAADHYVVGCLQDAGYEATFDGPYPVEPGRDAEYGLWRMQDAEADGYASLMAPDLDDVGAEWDTETVPAKASRDCYRAAQEAGLTYDAADFGDGPTGITSVMYTKDGQRIRDEWRECLLDHGASAPSSHEAGMVPDGVYGVSQEEQLRIATIDLGCKDELGTVQRLADVGAREEAAYIARAGDYLEDRHAVEQETLAAAEAYLDDAGVSMPWESR
ncbi:hypothetical protein [Isoptericola sp. NPDC019482]|uniref:hypothetical protein n=1 Tax=Isoptericola sp. NPDC019482 TaxID=3154688 RepID=UPI003499AB31